MKVKIFLISIISATLILLVFVGFNAKLDVSALFTTTKSSPGTSICTNVDETNQALLDACNELNGFSPEEPTTFIQKILNTNTKDKTTTPSETIKLINNNPKYEPLKLAQINQLKQMGSNYTLESTDPNENANPTVEIPVYEFPDFKLPDKIISEKIKDPVVYYNDDSQFPQGVEPTVETLEDYTDLYVYDYYIGDITEDDTRVFVDHSNYQEDVIDVQTVFLNVLSPRGILIEYPVRLRTMPNNNSFDITPPTISIDTNDIELTSNQFNDLSDYDLKNILATKYNFSVIDDYDGDITNNTSVSFQKVSYGVINSNPQIIINAFDLNQNYSEITLNVSLVKEVDYNAPNILGNTSLTTYDNEIVDLLDFKKLGISAYDKEDGDITNNIKLISDGGYNPNVLGSYELTYSVNDLSGKSSGYYTYTIKVGKNIVTCQELQAIGDDLDGYYKLQNDIDCNNIKFDPIGSQFNSFRGNLDGNGYQIINLTITNPEDGYSGLIASNHGIVSNLRLSDVNISGTSYVGAIAAYNAGTIINSSVSGVISGVGPISTVGGMVGNNAGIINSSFVDAELSAYNKVGGIVGSSSYGVMNNVYAVTTIKGQPNVKKVSKNYAGGLVGTSDRTVINNGYALVDIEENYFTTTGGIIGSSNSDHIQNMYVKITASPTTNGGYILGLNHDSVLINNYASENSSITLNNSNGFISVDANLVTLRDDMFYDLLWNDPLSQTFFTLSDTGLPYLNYEGSNGVGTNQILGYQESENRKEPLVIDPTSLPYILGDTSAKVNYKEVVDIEQPELFNLIAYDVDANPIDSEIKLLDAGGFSSNNLGIYEVSYVVVDEYDRTSEPYTVEVEVVDLVKPQITGEQSVTVASNMLSTLVDFKSTKLHATDNGDDITNLIEVYDSNGISFNETPEVGTYKISYVVTDHANNQSDIFIVTLEIIEAEYKIKSCADLMSIGKSSDYPDTSHPNVEWPSDGNYIIENDIDCTSKDNELVSNFDTIKSLENAVIDGDNHTISGVRIDNKGAAVVFEKVNNSVIKNINFIDIHLYSEDNTAALIKNVSGDVLISNVQVSGNITGYEYSSIVTSIVEKNSKLTIEKSMLSVNINGERYTGIFVGHLLGELNTNKNIIKASFYQNSEYTYEIIGLIDEQLDSIVVTKMIEAIKVKNVIKLIKLTESSQSEKVQSILEGELDPKEVIKKDEIVNKINEEMVDDDSVTQTDETEILDSQSDENTSEILQNEEEVLQNDTIDYENNDTNVIE